MEHQREHGPAEVIKSPPYGPALLFARSLDASRSTPEAAAGVVAETRERLLSQWEPGLVPTWGLDAKHRLAVHAHNNIEKCIWTVH